MAHHLGRYELLRPLARGGMAEIYLARRLGAAGVEKRLVIKRIRRERAASPDLLKLFVAEARVSVALTHQNIVPVFDFGRVGDEMFLAMEFIDGRDLAAVIEACARRGRPLEPMLVAHVGAEACAGLAYAHEKLDAGGKHLGIVHRDVTPANILVSFEGEVKLVDFGIAALRGEAGGLRGTPAYMSPEQARGETMDARSDLYSLGLVLREALAGKRPAAEKAFIAIARAQAGTIPPLPEDTPRTLAAILERATRERREDRFADAREMQQALDAFVLAERASAQGAGPAPRLAATLRELFGKTELAHGTDPSVSAPSGPVATFVDDGEDAVAETRAEAEVPPAAPDAEVGASPRRRRGLVFAIATSAALAAAVIVAVVAAGQSPRQPADRGSGAQTPPVTRDETPTPPAPPTPAPSPAPSRSPAPPALPTATAAPPERKPPATPKQARAAAPAPDAPPDAPKRRVTVRVRASWAQVYVDAAAEPRETPFVVELPPGPHRLRFVNDVAGVNKTILIDVPPDRDIDVLETIIPD